MTESDSAADMIVETHGTCGGRPRIAGHRIAVANVAEKLERQRSA